MFRVSQITTNGTHKNSRRDSARNNRNQKTSNEIKNSGTYLIYSNKKSAISKIEDLQKEIDAYFIEKVLKADFVSKTKEILNECTELTSSYNRNFVQQRKKDYHYLWSKDNISLDDAVKLMEVGFEFHAQVEGNKLFRKRK